MSVRRRVRHPADEQGIALIVALLIMLLCTIVVAGILQLSVHTTQRSGLTRNSAAALNAAEAGIQSELSLISDGSCPTSKGTETALPNQTAPSASYIIQVPVSCTAFGAAVIDATGYVPNATNPVTSTTMVAHINRTEGAPGVNGAYDFPDALFADAALSAPSGLNLYGSGGSIPNITAGSITIGGSGSQLGGAIAGQLLYGQSAGSNGAVSVAAAQIGGQVSGTNLTLTGPSTGLTVQQGLLASGNLSLNSVTVNGTGTYSGTYSHSGTVSGTVAAGAVTLPLGRPLGSFAYSQSPITSALGVGAPNTSCPTSATAWPSTFYDLGSCSTPYTPSIYGSGTTVIVVQGPFTVDVPSAAAGGQLYVIDAGGGGSDSLTIAGSGSTLPVFAFTDGSLNLSGTVVGQMAAHSITVASGTNMTFSPPATAMPDITFPTGYTAPNLAAATDPFIGTVSYEYQCPGTTAC